MQILGVCSQRPLRVSASTIVVSPDSSSPTLSSSSGMKTPDNTEEDPVDPETADGMEYSFVWLYCPSIGLATKNYL
jgi:hypothetical protein